MCDKNGLPHLFFTATADEVSKLKWTSVEHLESFLKGFMEGSTFQDAPVECTRLFHARFMRFFKEWIYCKQGKKAGLLGRVSDYVIRYEVQDRGSVHAHVVLWIQEEDREAAYNNIVASIPAEWDDNAVMSKDTQCEQKSDIEPPATSQNSRGDWVLPSNPLALRLFQITRRKQMHNCRELGKDGSCRKDKLLYQKTKVCKNNFPQQPQSQRSPVLDAKTARYLYYCPGYRHRNVVPHCPAIALVWNAHHNIQRIVHAAWSFYLMKYAMKVIVNSSIYSSPFLTQFNSV
jgi:hypothetical protein